jgi:ketosteroid isomerase-like protein
VAIIFILLGALAFTYKLIQKKDGDIEEDIVDNSEMNDTEFPNLAPIPELDPLTGPKTDPNSNPTPKLPDPVIPAKVPDSDIAKVDPQTDPNTSENTSENPINPPVVIPEPKKDKILPLGDPELLERAIGFINEARKERDKGFAKNAQLLISRLDSHATRANKEEKPLLEGLKKDIIKNRVPLTDNVTGLPDKLSNDFKDARSQEKTVDDAYLARIEVIRTAYITRLNTSANETSDDDELKTRLIAQAETAKDLDAWVSLLSPEPKWVPVKSSGSFGASDFAGNWDQFSSDGGGKTTRWIAHANGRMEIVDKDWDVTWKILEDGTLEVDWQKKKPYVYRRDGDGWVGETTFGKYTTLKRGNW